MSDAAPLRYLTGAADAIGWYYLAEGATHMVLKYRGHDRHWRARSCGCANARYSKKTVKHAFQNKIVYTEVASS